MKALQIFVILVMVLSTSLIAHSKHRDGYNNHHKHSKHIKRKYFKKYGHYVKVIKSRPIYRDVVVYEDYEHYNNYNGIIIGGVLGGIIGNSIDSNHNVPLTIGGTVVGAVIGSELSHNYNRHRYVEKELVGYKNIAFYRGKKIVEITDRPLRKIWVRDREHRYR